MKIYTKFIPEYLDEWIKNDPGLTDKPITIFYDYIPHHIDELNQNPYNIFFITEPNEFFGIHDWVMNNGHHFDIILTWDEQIIKRYPDKSILFLFSPGDLNLPPKYQENKTFEVSFLCGNKQISEGHLLRHRIYNMQDQIKVPHHFIYQAPWDGGKHRCWESMYHIAIENVKYNNWFTEKIMDCFLTKTIPLYWGAPNIGEFLNKEGIIVFENEHELIQIINNLTPEYYESKRDYIEENYQRCMLYANHLDRMNKVIKEICKLNEI